MKKEICTDKNCCNCEVGKEYLEIVMITVKFGGSERITEDHHEAVRKKIAALDVKGCREEARRIMNYTKQMPREFQLAS